MPKSPPVLASTTDAAVRMYFQMFPATSILWPDSLMELEEQDNLLSRTIMSPTNTTYPVSEKYSLRFLKSLINFCEEKDAEVSEAVLDCYTNLLQFTNSNEMIQKKPHFKTYYLKEDMSKFLTVMEDEFKITFGTTGLRTWPACFRFVSYIARHPEFVQGENIVELGAGVGLLGLACSLLGAKTTNLTDLHDEVLKRLEKNRSIFQEQHPELQNPIVVTKLDWEAGNYEEQIGSSLRSLDSFTVIGTDIVYDPSIIPHLVTVIDHLLSLPNCNGIYIWSTIRNEQTISTFRTCLSPLHVEEIKVESEKCDYFIETCELKNVLLRICKGDL